MFLLLLFLCRWESVISQLILYNSKQMINSHSLHFDCLYYRKRTEKLAYQHLVDIVDDLHSLLFSSDRYFQYS